MERLYKTIPTGILINDLIDAEEKNDQKTMNIIAYELACRIYVPGVSDQTFEELLYNIGYREDRQLNKTDELNKILTK